VQPTLQWKTISNTYSGYVFVALGTCAILSSVVYPALQFEVWHPPLCTNHNVKGEVWKPSWTQLSIYFSFNTITSVRPEHNYAPRMHFHSEFSPPIATRLNQWSYFIFCIFNTIYKTGLLAIFNLVKTFYFLKVIHNWWDPIRCF
jgi:hypothetical protein